MYHLDGLVEPGLLQLVVKLVGGIRRGQRHDLWPPAAGLLEGELHIVSRRHAHDREAVRETLDDAERAAANGAGRAKDGNTLHEGFSLSRFRGR